MNYFEWIPNEKNYFNLALVWFEEFICSSRRVFSSSICVIFQIILSLILFISLHSVCLVNKTYRVNDKFPLFYGDRFTLYMFVRPARTLSSSPNVAAPYLESSMQHHATLRHAMTRYNINTRYLHFHCLHFIQESYLLFGWQDFGVARFASWAKLKIRHAKPVLACKHPDDMFTLYQIALAQAHGS